MGEMGAVGEKNKDLLLLLPLVLLALRRRLPLLVSLGLLLGRDLLIETLGTALFIPPRLGEELVLVDGGIVIDLNVRGLQPPLVGRDERRDDFVEEHVGGRTSRDLRGATAVGGGLGGIRQPTLEIRRLAHRSAQHPTERARANGWARPHRANKNLPILLLCIKEDGSNNHPLGISSISDKISFFPYFFIKDTLSFIAFLIFFGFFACLRKYQKKGSEESVWLFWSTVQYFTYMEWVQVT